MSGDPRTNDTRRFRWVLVLTLAAYAAAGVGIYITEAPPAFEVKSQKYRIAQLLLRSDEDARKKAEEEARKRAEEEAKRRAEAEAKRRAEEEARRKADDEARKKAEAEARKRAEEEARKRAEEEAKRRAEEEARRKVEEEARRLADEEARKKAEEEAKRREAEEARRKAEEALRQAEEERRRAEAEARRLAEEARIQAAEDARRQAEAEARRQAEAEARRLAEEEARRKAAEEARRQAEEAARLARIRAALEEKRRREEEARRNQEAAMSAGLMAGMEGLDEDVQEFLPESQEPLVGSPEGNLLGGETPLPEPDAAASATGGGIPEADLAEIDQLLGNLEDMEGIERILGDTAADEVASKEEILAFLDDVAAGRVSAPMVARDTTVVESPFRILGEVGGVSVRKAEEITRIILSHRAELADLYGKALVRNPGFAGVVTVRMVIGADGSVREARVDASTTGVPGFDQAVVGRVLSWRFPAVAAGEVTGVYPFRFSEAR